jgi:hypothetical protein
MGCSHRVIILDLTLTDDVKHYKMQRKSNTKRVLKIIEETNSHQPRNDCTTINSYSMG